MNESKMDIIQHKIFMKNIPDFLKEYMENKNIETKLKVMISQPMRNLTEDEIINNRSNVVDVLNKMNLEIIDTIHKDYPGELNKHIPVYYLAKSIEYLSKVDVLYMMDGWEDARGCKIEHDIALAYGIQIMYENEGE